jgi:hypothetical protein
MVQFLGQEFGGISFTRGLEIKASESAPALLRRAMRARCTKQKDRVAYSDLNEVMLGNPAISAVKRSVAFRILVTQDLALRNGAVVCR